MTEFQGGKIVARIEEKKERKTKPGNLLFGKDDPGAESPEANALMTAAIEETIAQMAAEDPELAAAVKIVDKIEPVEVRAEGAGPTEGQAVETPVAPTTALQEQPVANPVDAKAPVVRNGTDAQRPPTVEEMVHYCAHVISTLLIKGLEAIGAYLLTHVFDGNYLKALSKDPYKGTSLNDLARHPDMPLSRQKLTECIRVAGVTQEFAASGVNSDLLTFYHKDAISKLRSQEARLKVARQVIAERLTVRETTDCVRQLMGRSTSQDKRMAQGLVKQMRNLAGMTVREDIRELLTDKERLKAALSTGETATLLDHSEQFRRRIGESQELLQSLEKTLVEIVVEARQANAPEEGPDAA